MNDDDDPGLALWARKLASTTPIPEPADNPLDLRAAVRAFLIPRKHEAAVLGGLCRFLQTFERDELSAVRADGHEVASFMRPMAQAILN